MPWKECHSWTSDSGLSPPARGREMARCAPSSGFRADRLQDLRPLQDCGSRPSAIGVTERTGRRIGCRRPLRRHRALEAEFRLGRAQDP